MSNFDSRYRPDPPSYEAFWKGKYETEKQKSARFRCLLMWLSVIAAVILVLLIVGLCLYFFVFKHKSDSSKCNADHPKTTITTTTSTLSTITTYPTLPPPDITNRTIVIPIPLGLSVDVIGYPNLPGNPAFLLYDLENEALVSLDDNGNVMSSRSYSMIEGRNRNCTTCRLYYADENCLKNDGDCGEVNAIYCCEQCARSNSAFCNIFGDTTTVLGPSPYLAGVYLPVSTITNQNQTQFIFNTKTKTSNDTAMKAFKYSAKKATPITATFTSTLFDFGINFDSLQVLYRNFDAVDATNLLYWHAYIDNLNSTNVVVRVATATQDSFTSFNSCNILIDRDDLIRIQLSTTDTQHLQITLIKQGQLGTEIWSCWVTTGSNFSPPPQLIHSSQDVNPVLSVSTREDTTIQVLDSKSNLLLYKIYWSNFE